MKIYCPECGSPANYTNKKPNFCSSCGYSYIKGEALASEHVDENVEQGEVTEQESNTIGSLNKLSVEIQADEYKGIEIQRVVQPVEAGTGPTIKQKRQGPPPGLKEGNIQDQFQKEAGALKKKNS